MIQLTWVIVIVIQIVIHFIMLFYIDQGSFTVWLLGSALYF